MLDCIQFSVRLGTYFVVYCFMCVNLMRRLLETIKTVITLRNRGADEVDNLLGIQTIKLLVL